MLDKSLLSELLGQEKLWVMFSPVTRHPFLYCDPETNEDQIFVFSDEELLTDNAQPFMDLKYPVTKVTVADNEKRKFFIDCTMLGVSEIVYVNEDGKHICQLDDILYRPDLNEVSGWTPVPDWRKIPEEQRPLFNPGLQTTLMYFAQELNRDVTPEEKKIGISYYIEEFEANLGRANFILPIMPREGLSIKPGQALDGTEFGIVILNDKEGNQWLPVFSDDMEFSMFNKENKIRGIKGTLSYLSKRMPDTAKGVLLNANSVAMQLQMQLLNKVFEKFKDEA